MARSVLIAVAISAFIFQQTFGQDSTFVRVHFLYGSKPKKAHRATERTWFGGVLGGHVGIETDSNQVFNFIRQGKVHWFARGRQRNSRYVVHSTSAFWELFKCSGETVKKATIVIPVSGAQKKLLDSIKQEYLANTPYDYAFFGMRCGSATYEVLGQLGIVKNYSYRKTLLKIFYPRKLRKRLLRKAIENHWTLIRQEGTYSRKWEKD